jgi:hypothetical protein
MGYITYVTAKLVIKESARAQVMKDIETAREFCDSASGIVSSSDKTKRPDYFDYHKAGCTFEEGILDCNPDEEGFKWYGMDEFINWLEGKVESGEFWWSGEEDDDKGAYRWIDGKMEHGTYELKWSECE